MRKVQLIFAGLALIGGAAHADDGQWLMDYYKHPEPQKISAYLEQSRKANLLSTSNTRAVTIGFMSQVMRDNPALILGWLQMSEKFSKEDRQVLLTAAWYSRAPQALDYFKKANVTSFAGQTPPDWNALPIEEAAHLDFYWARYFASGNAAPIRRIISALEYEKYSGAIEKYKSSKKTKEDEKAAIYDSIFQAAMWSLESNCKRDKNIYTICKELFFSAELNQTEKMWLVLAFSKARPDEFEVKIVSGKDSHLEIIKSPQPPSLDGASLAKNKDVGWKEDGKTTADSENRKSDKDFGAQLLLTEDAKFFDEWNKPETPSLTTANQARRNVPLYTVLLLSNPGLDRSESPDVAVDLTVRKPDASVYAEQKNLIGWKGPYRAPPFSLQLSQSRLGIRIEPQDPVGNYSVEAVVHDHIKKLELKLRTTFAIEK